MTPNKREQENERARVQFRRSREKLLSSVVAQLERLSAFSLARTLVIITAFLWLLLLVFGILAFHSPQFALLPLYALYPGAISSADPGYNATLMHAWGAGMGIVLLVLAIIAMSRKKRTAAITFTVLFLISSLIAWARILAALHAH